MRADAGQLHDLFFTKF